MRRVLGALLLTSATQAGAAAVGDALDRPAVAVRAPQRAVLLGAAMAGARIVAVGERGIVAWSDDDAKTWRQAATPTSVSLTAVRFADAQRGYAVGHGGVVLATEDGGQTWQRRLDGRQAAQQVLAEAKAAQAAPAGADARALQDAERLVANGPDKPLLDLLVQDAQHLVVVGAYGLALASEDGGRHWHSWMPRLPNPKGLHLYAVRQRGDTLLLAGEQGLAMASTDGGRSFQRLALPYKGSFFTAELLGERDWLLAGLRGNAWRSTDGGTTWAAVPTPMPVSITASSLHPQQGLLAVNQAGFVLALRGDHFVPLNAAPLPPLNAVLARPNAPLLALSVQGALPLPPAADAASPGPTR